MRFILALLAALLLLAAEAEAAVTTTQLGVANGTTTAVITTGANAPTGSLIVVVVSVLTSNVAVTSVADSAGNCTGAYTALDNTPVASRPTVAVFYCPNTGTLLSSGGTITVTVPSTDQVSATAFVASGMAVAPADTHAHSSNGASGTSATTVNTGTLGQAYELVVGALALNGTSSAFLPNGGFTSIGGTSSANGSAYAATQIACTTASVAFTPSWTTSRAYMSDVVSFKFAAADTACASKTNSYNVLQNGALNSANASKTNAYFVLQYSTSMSKTNAYFVLKNQKTTGGLFFHVFP